MNSVNGALQRPYFEIPGFSNVYLEDSYVIAVTEDAAHIAFTLDLVLCEAHPLYRLPEANEQYCYRRAELVFPLLQRVIWHERRFQPSIDANGEIDYGNIDTFEWEGNTYYLEGDWGCVTIESSTPILRISAQAQSSKVEIHIDQVNVGKVKAK